jgi:hypothetical protein
MSEFHSVESPGSGGLTEDDLRVLLLDRVGEPAHRSGRLAEVEARAGRIRRRRAAVTATLAVAVLALGLVVLRPGASAHTGLPAAPRPSASRLDDVPAYLRGGRLVALSERVDPRGVTVTFTPKTVLFGVVEGCTWPLAPADAAKDPVAQVTVNGVAYSGTGCSASGPLGTDGSADMGQPGEGWAHTYGIAVGKPVVVRFGWPGQTSRPGTHWRLAVYESVPIDAYPFPARPATLQVPQMSLDGYHPNDSLLDVRGLAGQPNRQVTSKATKLVHGLSITGVAVEPGEIEVLVNGRAVYSNRSWDYTEQSFMADLTWSSLGVAAGSTVVVTVRTSRYTGATWQVALRDAAP